MDYKELALIKHKEWKGKLEVVSRAPLATKDDLSTAYTPGVAQPCLEIANDPENAYVYTRKGNMVAVISDGSAVLGLGNIGGLAGMPVMEGKSILFKSFGGVDAFPICLDTQDTEEIINTIVNIAPCFGGINLEDISAPRCFEIERALIERLDIPVFHDDQHGTAIVVLAAIINSLKLAKKKIEDITVCISGAGAAGSAICRLLLSVGVKDVIMVGSKGIVHKDMEGMDSNKKELSLLTNKTDRRGSLKDAVAGADVFVGVSKGGLLTGEMVESMAKNAIVFAMANPVPEIFPDEAKKHGALVVGTGRSDYPNQVNNVLAFPGIFRGALDVRAKRITQKMKIAAAYALASLVSDEELNPDYVLPGAFDKRVAPSVARAVMESNED
ncbi:MAG: NAD-dependent malic enzyme [Clostridiales bacterium]|nr:NAD-dependent malic enzyme [Clostridiales bacterium]